MGSVRKQINNAGEELASAMEPASTGEKREYGFIRFSSFFFFACTRLHTPGFLWARFVFFLCVIIAFVIPFARDFFVMVSVGIMMRLNLIPRARMRSLFHKNVITVWW